MDLQINTKLFSSKGFLGRRDFFLNTLIIEAIALLVVYIINFCILGKLEPIGETITSLTIATIVYCLLIPSIIKRLNDINGKVDKNYNRIFVLLFGIIEIPARLNILVLLIGICIYIYLIARKGKLSSKLPYDYLNEFNWGAFFGTWIWGIVNKSYKTLWAIILWITPVSFLFSLICGLKGNKWAAKNRNWKNIEEFKSSQENQTIFFIILNIILIPILSLILLLGSITYLVQIGQQNPEKIDKLFVKFEKIVDFVTNSEFEKHEITKEENKFYISPNNWQNLNYSERRDLLEYAASVGSFKKNSHSEYGGRTSKKTELLITKIYNSENGELLGEFVDIDREKLKNSDSLFKDTFTEVIKSYKFYEPTKQKERRK